MCAQNLNEDSARGSGAVREAVEFRLRRGLEDREMERQVVRGLPDTVYWLLRAA